MTLLRKSRSFIFAASFLVIALCASGAQAAYTISVETFRNVTDKHVPVGSIMEMMTTELVNSGLFRVVERARLDTIAREQRLSQSGLMDSSTAPSIGHLAGAQYIMTGAVTQYSTEGTGGGFVIGGGKSQTGILGGSKTGRVTINARIIDSTTGAIVYSGKAVGAATNTLGGLLNQYVGFGTGRSGGLLAAASHKAVMKIVDALGASVGGGYAPGNPASASHYVLSSRGSRNITIDAGTASGSARRGRYYAVYREGGFVRDLHGNILDSERNYVAVIQIIDARPRYSICKLVKGGNIRRGDAIEPVSRPRDVPINTYH